MTQSRWKSKVLWVAIIFQLFVLADVVGLWQLFGIERSAAQTVVDAILQLLVIVGVVNNPSDAEKI